MYKNILVPVLLDKQHNTEAAFKVARALSDDDTKFTVLHVLEAIPGYVANQIPADMLADSRAEAEAALREAASALPGARVAILTGHSGQTILDYADAHDFDCIIVASHQPGMEDFFLGSTAARIVRHAKCAVHVIR